MEHSLGVKKIFPPLSPHVKAVFFLIPCLPVLSTPLSYVCCVCMDRLMANFAGTCTSDNKGLLLLLLLLLLLSKPEATAARNKNSIGDRIHHTCQRLYRGIPSGLAMD